MADEDKEVSKVAIDTEPDEDAPKGLRPKAQGCRFGYPGKEAIVPYNRIAVATL